MTFKISLVINQTFFTRTDQAGKMLRLMVYNDLTFISELSLVVRKPVLGVSDQVLHKAGCRPTNDG